MNGQELRDRASPRRLAAKMSMGEGGRRMDRIVLRLQTDYIRFDCADCKTEMDIEYLGYKGRAKPRLRFTCPDCGFTDERKCSDHWKKLPHEPAL